MELHILKSFRNMQNGRVSSWVIIHSHWEVGHFIRWRRSAPARGVEKPVEAAEPLAPAEPMHPTAEPCSVTWQQVTTVSRLSLSKCATTRRAQNGRRIACQQTRIGTIRRYCIRSLTGLVAWIVYVFEVSCFVDLYWSINIYKRDTSHTPFPGRSTLWTHQVSKNDRSRAEAPATPTAKSQSRLKIIQIVAFKKKGNGM